MDTVLIIGSGPNVLEARAWAKDPFDSIIAINNAWAVRPDWDMLIFPDDFDEVRRPTQMQPSQRHVTPNDYAPVQNKFGGFVYAGGPWPSPQLTGRWALSTSAHCDHGLRHGL